VTYDWGTRDFKKLVREMDETDAKLDGTMKMLRNTTVQSGLRPRGEAKKSLLDFVDEVSVHGMREAMKRSIEALQGIQQSFDGDLLRFDTDIRTLRKILADSPLPKIGDNQEDAHISITERLDTVFDHSSTMAQLLASLNHHFDMCVTAIRTTDGAVALARRKAAEVTQSQEDGGTDGVSISGVIAEQESNVPDLEPKTDKDRAEMLKVVLQDAAEVDDVVREMQEHLAEVDEHCSALLEDTNKTRRSHVGALEAYAALGEIGDRLGDYLAAEEEFKQRWDTEKEIVFDKLQEMSQLKEFYDRYSGAYDSLILEVERRKAVDDKVRSIWRKAQDSVDKILREDQTSREAFRHDVGEFLPTDLWAGMQGAPPRWELVPVSRDAEVLAVDGSQGDVQSSRRSITNGIAKTQQTGRRESPGGEESLRSSSKRG